MLGTRIAAGGFVACTVGLVSGICAVDVPAMTPGAMELDGWAVVICLAGMLVSGVLTLILDGIAMDRAARMLQYRDRI